MFEIKRLFNLSIPELKNIYSKWDINPRKAMLLCPNQETGQSLVYGSDLILIHVLGTLVHYCERVGYTNEELYYAKEAFREQEKNDKDRFYSIEHHLNYIEFKVTNKDFVRHMMEE